MQPKTRLTLLIVAMVATIVLALSSLYLHGLAEARFETVTENAKVASGQVRNYLLQRVREHTRTLPAASLDETKRMWQRYVHDDPHFTAFLVASLYDSSPVVEILITDGDGKVLSSSNPIRLDQKAPRALSLEDWDRQSTLTRLWQILSRTPDYELMVPLGTPRTNEVLFTIRVLVSPVLLRSLVLPQLRRLALVSLLSIVISAIIAGLLANFAARPLERVSQLIDLIAEGKPAAELPPPPDPQMAAVQSKLTLLGEQIRGATEDASQLRGNVAQLVERFEDAVLLFDKNDRLVMAGKSAERFLPHARDLIGRSLDDVFPSSTPVGAVVETSAHLNRPFKDQLLSLESNGNPARVLVSVEVIEDFPSRRRLGTMVTLRDAESRRQLKTQLDVSYRHEAMGHILRGVVHEIKNPLNSIYTHLQMLQLEVGDSNPQLQQEVSVISREIKLLDRMVVTLLDFTKPLEIKREETDLVRLASDIAGLVQPEAAKKNVVVSVSHNVEAATVWADYALLRQAVMNVVINAIESMNNPGKIEIAVSRSDEEHLLCVSDEGPGIPPEIQPKIFNLYFTTKRRGSGIGLAMSYRVVQLHEGTLDFESEAGKGTTFRFRFPQDTKRVAA
jgi:signal transduction histidine kinase